MKKKVISLSLVVICVTGLLWKFAVPQPSPKVLPTDANDSNELIVAPALIDSLTDITRVPTLQSGIIKRMDVTVGQQVKKGQPLFSLDSTLIENNVNIQKINLEQARNQLVINHQNLNHSQQQLERLQSLDKRAISQADLQEKIYLVNMAREQLKQTERMVELAQANLKQAELTLSQFTTLAPKDAVVLQINAHVNEFVGGPQPVVLLGDAKKVMVRVSLDERDIQRFKPNEPAYLTSNENGQFKIPLIFLQMDKYIVTQERLNFSRVQEAIYFFNRDDYPDVVAGQQFDANISIHRNA